MAKDTAQPEPAAVVVLMGAELLAAIASGQVTRITQEQAGSLDAATIEINTADVVDGAALVRLAQVAETVVVAAAPAAKSGKIEIDDDFVMPANLKRRSPREAIYPFDDLAVGQSFHIAKTAENPDPATRVSSSVTGAHQRFSKPLTNEDGSPKMEDYKSAVYKRTEDGKDFLKGADGKRILDHMATKTRQAMSAPSREFKIVPVDATDKRGEGVRVVRIS